MRGLILVVEDERAISDLLRLYISREGFGVHVATDGLSALSAARTMHPAAIVLDVGLPAMDGTEVCRALRAEGNWVPILFCTARDDEVDRVLGLELGADDYITKPFSPREVVARIKSVVRRASLVTADEKPLELGEVTVDLVTRRVTLGGEPVALTATEFDLLAHLMRHPGRVYSREQLLSEVWGYAAVVGTRTVDVHVAQVRGKLGDRNPIRTVRGVGYSAEAPDAS
ncbi:MAG: response regulator transcription factor [Actinobacteria bacterium]|jgi:DNA-binding response OmpR family regulator|nr:response regulator transcription factor [Actinomycetota bacterium]